MIKLRYAAGLAALATALLVALSTPAQAAVVWVQVATPDQGNDYNQLTGATTVSAGEAWSVGLTRTTGTLNFQPLVEHWTTAGGWRLSTSASGTAGTDARLVAVAGTAATDVWAVGQIGFPDTHALIEHWNGSSWSRVSAPASEPAGSALLAVATVSSTDAWAVGITVDPVTSGRAPLMEHWNGAAWSVLPSPTTAVLTAITAISADDVWAVGGPHGQIPVALHWDGKSWTSVPLAFPTGETTVTGVAAASSRDVWLVGQAGLRTWTEHWDGKAWSVVPSPGLAGQDILSAVTVLSSGDVWAVGQGGLQSAFHSTLTEHWDGTAWTVVASPNSASAINTDLDGVAGRTGGPLLAVGTSHNLDGTNHAFGISG
jgi:hypothetical protein